eukprot:TRINITY_DN7974_c0_g1_i1.p1 TRINITY_DN7974_c0_g1~~TRINITY_DN7974_c0_g1_i1.p1  ORF type:complete len:447 (+),score=60.28 TRINITY_DN7974_c0_g1_i1:342-1682(+)
MQWHAHISNEVRDKLQLNQSAREQVEATARFSCAFGNDFTQPFIEDFIRSKKLYISNHIKKVDEVFDAVRSEMDRKSRLGLFDECVDATMKQMQIAFEGAAMDDVNRPHGIHLTGPVLELFRTGGRVGSHVLAMAKGFDHAQFDRHWPIRERLYMLFGLPSVSCLIDEDPKTSERTSVPIPNNTLTVRISLETNNIFGAQRKDAVDVIALIYDISVTWNKSSLTLNATLALLAACALKRHVVASSTDKERILIAWMNAFLAPDENPLQPAEHFAPTEVTSNMCTIFEWTSTTFHRVLFDTVAIYDLICEMGCYGEQRKDFPKFDAQLCLSIYHIPQDLADGSRGCAPLDALLKVESLAKPALTPPIPSASGYTESDQRSTHHGDRGRYPDVTRHAHHNRGNRRRSHSHQSGRDRDNRGATPHADYGRDDRGQPGRHTGERYHRNRY